MSAGYFKKMLAERNIRNIEVRSAGVMTITGLLANQEANQVMENEGVDLRLHRSTPLSAELIRKADLVLAMTPFHRQSALRQCEEAKSKTFLFKEFTRTDLKNVQIADPMGGTLEVFKKCFKEIKSACNKLIEHEFVTGKKPQSQREKPKKPAVKKPAAKKPAAKKPAAKKPAAKKSAAKKSAAKKSAKKTKSPEKKKPASKSRKKTATKRFGTPKKQAAKSGAKSQRQGSSGRKTRKT